MIQREAAVTSYLPNSKFHFPSLHLISFVRLWFCHRWFLVQCAEISELHRTYLQVARGIFYNGGGDFLIIRRGDRGSTFISRLLFYITQYTIV